ncbi:hypothetical protein SHKM778_87990 [Streptomyces sp. KM77-8]|uniref:Uncharacterized protein n=1 Tax=Streptomyces haneummycinicus TaxID=3074435 RepID=A0AAT9HYD9_9ACTN
MDDSDASRHSFVVWPGTVSPDPGTYTIGNRTEATTGSDGVPVEHIMYFAQKSGVWVAFSNAVDGTSPPRRPGRPDGRHTRRQARRPRPVDLRLGGHDGPGRRVAVPGAR